MAKRFRFRLEPLLKIREAKKKDAQRLLGVRMGELQRLKDYLASLKELQAEAAERRRAKEGEPINIDLWRSIERYLASLDRKMNETDVEIAQAQELVDEARRLLTIAHREHLTLVRLKERRREQHDFEVALEEQQQADELAVLRYQFNSVTAS